MGKNKVVGIIPARFGSKRFPGKPLALINGVPMITRVIRQAQKAKRLTEVWVATDDQRIEQVAKEAGALTVMTPIWLKSGTDRIAYAVKNKKVDIVVNIQGDEPVISPRAIDTVVDVLEKNPKILMSTIVIPIKNKQEWMDPNVVKAVLAVNKNVLYFSRSAIPYRREGGWPQSYKHMGIYGYRYSWLNLMASLKPTFLELTEKLEQLRAMENSIVIRASVLKIESLAVDVLSDIKKVEKYLNRK